MYFEEKITLVSNPLVLLGLERAKRMHEGKGAVRRRDYARRRSVATKDCTARARLFTISLPADSRKAQDHIRKRSEVQ